MGYVFPFQGLFNFLIYFITAAALTGVFQWIYLKVTPYDEIALIRNNNTAAAIAYGGALIGFVLPVASVIAHAANLVDCAIWATIALIIQLVTFTVFRRMFPGVVQAVATGEQAQAVFLAAVSIAIGVLNAACLTY